MNAKNIKTFFSTGQRVVYPIIKIKINRSNYSDGS